MQIYRILNTNTGKSYIGKSVDYIKRFEGHKKCALNHKNTRLYDSMNHHGIDAFTLILVEELGDVSRQVANDRETYWVAYFNTVIPHGYNMTKGGDGGHTLEHWSDEDRAALYKQQALTRTGSKRTDAAKQNIKEASIKREASRTVEDRINISQKISDTNKKKGISPPDHTKWKKGQIGTFTGKTHTQESRTKISTARAGKNYDDLYGLAESTRQRLLRKTKWSAENNPRYIEFSADKKQQIIEYLSTHKIKMKDISTLFSISEFKIRQWFREIGVDNYQQLCYKLIDDSWEQYWRIKCSSNLKTG